VPSDPTMSPLPDLVGQAVDLYLNGEAQPIKGAKIEYVRKSWCGFSFVYRKVQHHLHCPLSAITKIDHKNRLPPRR